MILLDLLYVLALVVLSPWLLWRSVRTGRYRNDLAAKLLGRVRVDHAYSRALPVVWFHAVSVGEVNLLATLIPAFQKRRPDCRIVVSATTDTGLAEARRRFSDRDVIAWPFDFSWAVAAALDAVRPALIVLTESELWPNFLQAAGDRAIPVIAVNARMSPRSFARLKRVRGLAARFLFARVSRFAVQEQEYAERLRQLGVPRDKLAVTGSVKYDGAIPDGASEKTAQLRRLLGVSTTGGAVIWLAGSTHAPEEAIVLAVFARLRVRFPGLRLILVPRHPDRFEEVAGLVEQSRLPVVRRSRVNQPLAETPAVTLLDTLGELGAAWGLADVGFTGGSLDGTRGGQSMIEPAGYGVPCAFGPHVWNFKDAAKRLLEVGGAVMVNDELQLEEALAKLIGDPELRARMGLAARDLVRRQQGATARTLEELDALLPPRVLTRAA
jgi:3-deoxy-D-manno-octulosonic-acid transferase